MHGRTKELIASGRPLSRDRRILEVESNSVAKIVGERPLEADDTCQVVTTSRFQACQTLVRSMMSSWERRRRQALAMLAGETVAPTFECVLEEELLVGVDDPVLADTAALIELELVVAVALVAVDGGGGISTSRSGAPVNTAWCR